MISKIVLVLSGMSGIAAFAGGDLPDLQTMSHVDLSRYGGTWHQIAYFPTRFQKNCERDVTAEYTLRADGVVIVENQCSKENGTRKSIKGTARASDSTNSKLKVKFFWFAPAGDYWVIELDPDYQYAVVSAPNRNYLWILSRSPTMTRSLYESLLKRISAQHLDVGRIKLTSQLD